MLMRQIFTLQVNVFAILFSFDACMVSTHEGQVDMLNGLEYMCWLLVCIWRLNPSCPQILVSEGTAEL